jgi:hypothetical protein
MNSRAILIAALLASPAWSQEHLDLHSDAIKAIVRNNAASQYSDARVTEQASSKGDPVEFVYVPPEDSLDEVPVREAPKQPSAPEVVSASKGNTFLSSVFEILIDEALDRDEDDGITSSNEILRCRIQKEQKTSPPGIDNCPSVD